MKPTISAPGVPASVSTSTVRPSLAASRSGNGGPAKTPSKPPTTRRSAKADRSRLQRDTTGLNEHAVIDGMRQYERPESAEKLNEQPARGNGRAHVGEMLFENEQRYRALFDLGPVAVYSCDASGVIRDCNRTAVELWGREPQPGDTDERFCGSFKLYRPDGTFMPHDTCPMADVLSGKIPEARDGEVHIERPDGSRVIVIVNIRPLKNERGEINGAINCFVDITARKRVEERLEKTVADRTASLCETIAELESWSYSIAHDMRAPLRAMQGFASLLSEEHSSQLDGQGIEYLRRIATAAHRLDRLIQDVLNYSKILKGQVDIQPVDLDSLTRDIINTYPDWQPPKATLEIQGTLPRVLGNAAFLTQCISNLLSNAVKFVPPGTSPVVKIWAEPNQNLIRILFEDNGIGIAPEKHSRIFRMFDRINPASAYEGTGIGLTVARKAVERMGGQIGFESAPGKGSKFWIQLTKA